MSNERVEFANNLLSQGVESIARLTEEMCAVEEVSLSGDLIRTLEFKAGGQITRIVNVYLQSIPVVQETDLHARQWVPVRDGSNYVLCVDNCTLYSTPSIWDRSRDRWPQTSTEWLRHWRGIVEGIVEASRQ